METRTYEDNIKTQGRPIPGIDYGINMVSRKKNYDEDGNSLDDYSEDIDIGNDRESPTPSVKSYRTNTNASNYGNNKLDSPRVSEYSQNSRRNSPIGGYSSAGAGMGSGIGTGIDDNEKDKHSSHSSRENHPQPTWLNDRNFMGEYDDDKTLSGDGDGDGGLDNETVIEPPKMTFAEIQRAKEDYIAKLARLESKGYRSVKIYSLTSELKDIEEAYNKTYSQYSCDKAIKFQGKILIGVVGFIEGLNNKYDPFNIYLTGWSEALYENLDEYEEVFEELYEKYQEQFEMISPEIRLFGMVVMSGVMFHFSHAVIAKAKKMMPGFDTVMNENPELKKQYVAAAAKQGMPVGSGGSGGSGGIGRDGGSSGIGGDGGSSGKGGFLSNLMSGIPMLNTIMKNMNKPSKPSNMQEQVQRQEKAQEQTQRQSKAPKTRQNNTKIEFSRQNNYADDLLKGMTNTKRRDISEMDSIGDLSEDD